MPWIAMTLTRRLICWWDSATCDVYKFTYISNNLLVTITMQPPFSPPFINKCISKATLFIFHGRISFTEYYDLGRLPHADSQDANLYCHVLIFRFPLFVALCDHNPPMLQTDVHHVCKINITVYASSMSRW